MASRMITNVFQAFMLRMCGSSGIGLRAGTCEQVLGLQSLLVQLRYTQRLSCGISRQHLCLSLIHGLPKSQPVKNSIF